MAHPDTQESRLLCSANGLIDKLVARRTNVDSARLSLLEAVVCYKTGFRIDEYRSVTGFSDHHDWDKADVACLAAVIEDIDMPFALALAGLSRIDEGELKTKRNGAVYTDFRLATYLADKVMQNYDGGAIIDPACGTAIVLAACAECAHRNNGDARSIVSSSLYGVDQSPNAIRGSFLVLASFLRERIELEQLVSHFACLDSLAMAEALPSHFGLEGFTLVVGNPPWERVRPSRNEYARECGLTVSYGAELDELPNGYEQHRAESKNRAALLSKKYNLKGGMDLYRAFLRLSIDICRDGGIVMLYLPAGLIRSKSLAPERELVLNDFAHASMTVFTNRPKFFRIDSRFKFVLAALCGKGKPKASEGVSFTYCDASPERVSEISSVRLADDLFNDASNELGAPEVKTDAEATVLRSIWNHGTRMDKHPLFGGIQPVRELDMTLDRWRFKRLAELDGRDDIFPLIEGRMVSPYRCGCKRYLSGSGRSARWAAVPHGASDTTPQFVLASCDLDEALIERANHPRIGYCDIAGQTNERAMQAAIIPPGCVCGNKVPTICYENDEIALLWLGIANSFVFDWVIRRYITTTINFFILKNLPFPNLDLNSEFARGIVDAARRIVEMERCGTPWGEEDRWTYANLRANIDAWALRAYGLQPADLQTIIDDFPLVDQENAKACGGARPTIELLAAYVRGDDSLAAHITSEYKHEAMPYASNEYMRELPCISHGRCD